MSRSTTPAAILTVAALLLGACTWDPDPASSGTSTGAPSASATAAGSSPDAPPSREPSSAPAAPTSAPPPPPAPDERACYRLRHRELTRPSSDRDPVACTKRHTSVTIHVGRLDTVVDGHAVAVDSRHAQRQLARACPRRLADFLGGSTEDLALSRFEVAWFSPTVAQSDRGATWYRCDLVGFGQQANLLPLPSPRSLSGVLEREAGRERFGLCGSAAPGTSGFRRVVCSRPHAWRAIATIPLTGGGGYPGVGAVRAAGDDECRDVASRAAGSADEFRYGWEWPTRSQWRVGQRFGYCWAPD